MIPCRLDALTQCGALPLLTLQFPAVPVPGEVLVLYGVEYIIIERRWIVDAIPGPYVPGRCVITCVLKIAPLDEQGATP